MYRTKLKKPDDIDNVKKFQAAYRVQPLSSFIKSSTPDIEPINFIEPPNTKIIRNSPEFFNTLSFLLQFTPTHPSEVELRQ